MNKDQIWPEPIEQYNLLPKRKTDFRYKYRHRIKFANEGQVSLYGEDYFGDKKVFWTTHQSILNSLWLKAQDDTKYPMTIYDLNFNVEINIPNLKSFTVWLSKNQPFQPESS